MSSSDLVSLVEAELPDVLHVSQIQARSDDDVEGLRYVRGAEGVDVRTLGDTRRVREFQVEARWDATDGFLFSLPPLGCWCGQSACTCTLGIECVRIGNLSVSASRDMLTMATDPKAPHGRITGRSEGAFNGALRHIHELRLAMSGCRFCADLWSSHADGSNPARVAHAIERQGSQPGRTMTQVDAGLEIAGGAREWTAVPGHHSPQSPMLHRVPSRRTAAVWDLSACGAPHPRFHTVYASPFHFPCEALLLDAALRSASLGTTGVLTSITALEDPTRTRAPPLLVVEEEDQAVPRDAAWVNARASDRVLRCLMLAMAVAAVRHRAQAVDNGGAPVQPSEAGDSSRDADDLLRTVEKFVRKACLPAEAAKARLSRASALASRCGGLEGRATTVRNGVAQLVADTVVAAHSDTRLHVRVRLCGLQGTVAASLLTQGPYQAVASATVRVSLYNYASMWSNRGRV